jgi:hypothetical protein
MASLRDLERRMIESIAVGQAELSDAMNRIHGLVDGVISYDQLPRLMVVVHNRASAARDVALRVEASQRHLDLIRKMIEADGA